MRERKLVIWDAAWTPYADEFASRLGPGWRVASEPNNLDWLLDEIQDASALLALRMPKEALPLAGGLQLFLYPGAGVQDDHPVSYPAGCSVANVFEHEVPIAEYVLMAMLVHATGIHAHMQTFAEGKWHGSGRTGGTPHQELAGRTVGLFGYGRIGRAIAVRARAFGMRIAAVSRSGIDDPTLKFAGRMSELDTLLGQSDFLIIAAPLTAETSGAIGERELALLPEGAYLVNVARGPIVDEDALYQALTSGRLSGAALDVWYQYPEPGRDGHGSRLPFHALPNVIATPHYSAWTKPMILRRIDRMVENLHRLARGEELERVVLRGAWRP